MNMKKIVSLLLTLLLLSGLALADSVVGDSGDSWIRSGPGLSYERLGLLGEGDLAEYLGSTSADNRGVDWYYVRFGSVTGWVSSRYTVLSTSTSGGDWNWGSGSVRYVRATARVNVRSGPGTSYEDVGTLVRGECLTYLDETRYDAAGNAWYKAEYYSYGEVWVSAVYSELTYARTEAASDGDAGTAGSYIEATGNLNVRSGPGLGYADKGTIARGGTAAYLNDYSVDERGVTWYKISWNGGEGWVSSRYCELH